jgi:hypothetical protein
VIWVWRATVEWYWQGKNRRTRRQNCLIATLPITNPTWTNPGLRFERPAAEHLSHGAVQAQVSSLTLLINCYEVSVNCPHLYHYCPRVGKKGCMQP